MASLQAAALRQFYAALETYPPLVALTGHVPGATSLGAGARIIGDSVRLRPHPIPGVVLGLGNRNQGGKATTHEALRDWEISLLVWAEDVFQAAEIAEAVEDFCSLARWETGPVRQAQWVSSQQMELSQDQEYISVLITVRLRIA
ncbi:hypothetical protein Mesil_1209 [Allomeiothermus silvanus DSM 9946]|uniref:DUF3168 domain-containing protein n=1 Tax=Allomeiothermus silvanus (strain ATCC 700542 / DSM 9946 / NBRC 106475 / NCIMB 13440 / VI-R2) TaxID=526227 RepID=D7BDV5_ALLS1|nr:hypothetical protein [Allomeiothermus silvanus]ADH63106.1 hypothetical protein Mesil_1209 [Allomeiothermus silvanus DSM 9946]